MMLADFSSFLGSVWAVGLALVVGIGAGYYLRSKKQF
jgi:uncharacterized membrane protein YciS (DUF1049 family)